MVKARHGLPIEPGSDFVASRGVRSISSAFDPSTANPHICICSTYRGDIQFPKSIVGALVLIKLKLDSTTSCSDHFKAARFEAPSENLNAGVIRGLGMCSPLTLMDVDYYTPLKVILNSIIVCEIRQLGNISIQVQDQDERSLKCAFNSVNISATLPFERQTPPSAKLC